MKKKKPKIDHRLVGGWQQATVIETTRQKAASPTRRSVLRCTQDRSRQDTLKTKKTKTRHAGQNT